MDYIFWRLPLLYLLNQLGSWYKRWRRMHRKIFDDLPHSNDKLALRGSLLYPYHRHLGYKKIFRGRRKIWMAICLGFLCIPGIVGGLCSRVFMIAASPFSVCICHNGTLKDSREWDTFSLQQFCRIGNQLSPVFRKDQAVWVGLGR